MEFWTRSFILITYISQFSVIRIYLSSYKFSWLSRLRSWFSSWTTFTSFLSFTINRKWLRYRYRLFFFFFIFIFFFLLFFLCSTSLSSFFYNKWSILRFLWLFWSRSIFNLFFFNYFNNYFFFFIFIIILLTIIYLFFILFFSTFLFLILNNFLILNIFNFIFCLSLNRSFFWLFYNYFFFFYFFILLFIILITFITFLFLFLLSFLAFHYFFLWLNFYLLLLTLFDSVFFWWFILFIFTVRADLFFLLFCIGGNLFHTFSYFLESVLRESKKGNSCLTSWIRFCRFYFYIINNFTKIIIIYFTCALLQATKVLQLLYKLLYHPLTFLIVQV